MKYVLLIAALLLPACSERQQGAATINNPYVKYEGTPRAYAYEFHLTDGTRCVAYSDSITCEWRQPVVLVPRPE